MLHRLLTILAVSTVLGCGAGTGLTPNAPKEATPKLAELRDLLVEATGSPPLKKQTDMDQFKNRYPSAVQGVADGSLSYVWGASIKEGVGAQSAIIAYETVAESQGGWVVRESSAIEKLSLEDFKKEAPKKVVPKK